jgi:hypothetical protein
MIALFTDFGLHDPYVGQLHAVLARNAPGIAVIDLFHAVPDFDVRAGAYLLPALAGELPPGSVLVCVVDPGVGGTRRALWLEADGRRYVGPDNGLFELVARRAQALECREICWRPPRLAPSFHGRDLFAPVAARLARGLAVESLPAVPTRPAGAWPDDLPVILYIDHYGNAITGLRAAQCPPGAGLTVARARLAPARVFGEVAPGSAFWYANSNGLVEIAVNRGSAAAHLGLTVGDPVTIE